MILGKDALDTLKLTTEPGVTLYLQIRPTKIAYQPVLNELYPELLVNSVLTGIGDLALQPMPPASSGPTGSPDAAVVASKG